MSQSGGSSVEYAGDAGRERTFLGHPLGLFVLFFAELWERFNFYGMRALLIFYMTKWFMFEDKFATTSYGAINGLIYATPLIGGMIADRMLGYRRSIVLGGILMACGQFGLLSAGLNILPNSKWTFYTCIAFIVAGNGFFKPNISTMVGTLYKQGDPRRDGAFTIFYMGINIGAFLSPIICGIIGERYGYHYGFGLAGVGMVIGLLCFTLFTKHLGERGLPPVSATAAGGGGLAKSMLLYGGIIAFIPIGAFLVSEPHFVEAYAAPIIGFAFIAYILWEAFRSSKTEREGTLVVVILTTFSIAFWAFFEQAGSSINLFTDRHVDRTVFGWEIPASAFQAVNALFIVLLAPVFSVIWLRLGRVGRDPSSAMKFVLALVQLGLGFVALVLAAKQAEGGAKASLLLLLLAYFFHTTGELCLSPVGLSMVTKMAPTRLAGLLMGMWFLSAAFAHVIGGKLAGYSADWGYSKLYTVIFVTSIACAVLLLVIYPIIKRWEKARIESHNDHAGAFPVVAESKKRA